MINFREYKDTDAKTILSFIPDADSFYKWSATALGTYPLSTLAFINRINEMKSTKVFYPYVMIDADKVIGFFILRYWDPNINSLTIGFVVIDPTYRGKGIGKKMVSEAINLAFNHYKADSCNLRVFDCNPSAYNCYKSVGFKENGITKTYEMNNKLWKVIELELNNNNKI